MYLYEHIEICVYSIYVKLCQAMSMNVKPCRSMSTYVNLCQSVSICNGSVMQSIAIPPASGSIFSTGQTPFPLRGTCKKKARPALKNALDSWGHPDILTIYNPYKIAHLYNHI